ncbi:hypothetical protein GQ44DRAFT_159870 [Phaeosphaeriaceae sp. PMI808]|nr:hypothetical protein GQ44DRAFT_159870 [Phaeosphaeriaceae sp. PMI808]
MLNLSCTPKMSCIRGCSRHKPPLIVQMWRKAKALWVMPTGKISQRVLVPDTGNSAIAHHDVARLRTHACLSHAWPRADHITYKCRRYLGYIYNRFPIHNEAKLVCHHTHAPQPEILDVEHCDHQIPDTYISEIGFTFAGSNFCWAGSLARVGPLLRRSSLIMMLMVSA